jgi:hypothetical protein
MRNLSIIFMISLFTITAHSAPSSDEKLICPGWINEAACADIGPGDPDFMKPCCDKTTPKTMRKMIDKKGSKFDIKEVLNKLSKDPVVGEDMKLYDDSYPSYNNMHPEDTAPTQSDKAVIPVGFEATPQNY